MKKHTTVTVRRAVLLAAILILGVLLAGCAKKDTASTGELSSGAEKAGSSDTGSDTAGSADASVPPQSVSGAGNGPSAQDPTAENKEEGSLPGEGINAVAGEVQDTPGVHAVRSIGEDYDVVSGKDSEQLSYTVRIDAVEVTEDRNPYETTPADLVVKVVYTVSSREIADPILVDAMSFRLTDEEQRAYAPYFLDPAADERADILPVEAGKSATFAIGFAVTGSPKEVTLLFEDVFRQSGCAFSLIAPL